MKRLFTTANIYMILGLVFGLYYREFTKINDFTGETQLAVLHTHLLALGMLFFLIVLALDKVFGLSDLKLFKLFFWFYNGGLALTVVMMFVHGTLDVLGKEMPPALAGISGLGHIILTVGLILFFHALGKRVKVLAAEKKAEKPAA